MNTGIRWLIAVCYLASLPFMRRAWEIAGERGGRAFADALPIAAALSLVGALAWYLAARKREKRLSVYLFLAGICAVAAFLLRSLPEPIMRIHVAQYALLGVLVFGAMGGEREGWTFCLWAALAASALGYADESFQGLLPSRIYDLQDVALNIESVLLGQAVLLLVLRPWEAHGAAPRRPREPGRARLPAIACAILLALALADAALIEKGSPTLGGRGNIALRGRDGYRFFGPAAVAANAAAAAAAAGLLVAAGGGLRGAARALRSAAVCALCPPLILITGKLFGLHFR